MPIDRHEKIIKRVVAYLSQERKRQKISMYRLARMAKIGDRTISKIEKGDQSPTLYILLKMATALNVSIGSKLEEIEIKEFRRKSKKSS